jgi:hypothetical protein
MDYNNTESKGQNVKVVLRCRPMSAKERQIDKVVLQCVSDRNAEVTYSSLGKSAKRAFTFDGVYDDKTTQEGLVRINNVTLPPAFSTS